MSTVTHLPIRLDPPTNDERLEAVFEAVDGLPPARAKRLIMRWRDPAIGWIDDVQAEIALDALGLRAA